MSDYFKQYYNDHADKIKKSAKKWAENNRERRRAIGKRYYQRKKEKDPEYYRKKARKEYHKNPEKHRQYAVDYRNKIRFEMLQAYGNQCACCGEAEPIFLTIEHKNRDGHVHRKQVGNTPTSVYMDLKRRNWPKDNYELLCFNCNRGAWALGTCPHRLKGEDDNE